MIVVLAEKNSLKEKIAAALGDECEVLALSGHLYELDSPDAYTPNDCPRKANGKKVWRAQDLPILPKRFTKSPTSDPKTGIPDARTVQRIREIKAALKTATEVVNAGDPDREGQILVDELIEDAGYTGRVTRLWLPDLDADAIREQFRHRKPNSEYRNLSDAADSRGKADWLVGMNMTQAWTLKSGKFLPVGRVQTPTLKIVVDRDREIENFKPRHYFEIYTQVKHQASAPFKAKWTPAATDVPGFDPFGKLIDKPKADALARSSNGQGIITEFKATKKTAPPPLPLDLGALKKLAGSKFSLGSAEILEVAQRLYLAELTTYPRVECRYLNESQLDPVYAAAERLAHGFGVEVSKRRHAAFDDKKVGAHTAIVPTEKDASHLTGVDAKVYDLIARAAVALFMDNEDFLTVSVTARAPNNEIFQARGRRVLRPGWTAVYGKEESDEDDTTVPDMAVGDAVVLADTEAVAKSTKPPSRFTETTLDTAMGEVYKFVTDDAVRDKLKNPDSSGVYPGIGTQATRSAIITGLIKKGLLSSDAKKKTVISTPAGRDLVDALPPVLTSPASTAEWETQLYGIEKGQTSPQSFLANIATFINEQLEIVDISAVQAVERAAQSGPTAPCPVCKAVAMRLESTKFPGRFYWRCHSGTHAMMKDVNGEPGDLFEDRPASGSGARKSSGKSSSGKGGSGKTAKCPECGKTATQCESKTKPGVFYWRCESPHKLMGDKNGKPGAMFSK